MIIPLLFLKIGGTIEDARGRPYSVCPQSSRNQTHPNSPDSAAFFRAMAT